MDFLDKLEEAAVSGGKAAMEQMDRLRKLAAAEARLLQLKRELCGLYMDCLLYTSEFRCRLLDCRIHGRAQPVVCLKT